MGCAKEGDRVNVCNDIIYYVTEILSFRFAVM